MTLLVLFGWLVRESVMTFYTEKVNFSVTVCKLEKPDFCFLLGFFLCVKIDKSEVTFSNILTKKVFKIIPVYNSLSDTMYQEYVDMSGKCDWLLL